MYITQIGNKYKIIVKQRCADSIDQTIDMYNVWKLYKLH